MPSSRVTTVLLIIITGFVVGVILYLLRAVLLPLVIAMLLSNLFLPVVQWLRARRVPTLVALFVVVLVVAGVITLLSLMLYSSAESFVEELPKYQARFLTMILAAQASINDFALQLGMEDPPQLRLSELVDPSFLTSAVTAGVGSFVSFFSNAFLVLLFMLFILAETADVGERIRRAFPANRADRVSSVLLNIDSEVRQYLLTKTLTSLADAILVTIVLWIVGVDFALLWGFVTFLLNFIPNIGSIIATILPFLASLVQFDTLAIPILVLILLGAIQMLMGNVVEPRWMASSLNLSALLVLFALIFWGWLWGGLGMVLAVPLTSTLKIIFENVDDLKPVAILMAGHVPKPVDVEVSRAGAATRPKQRLFGRKVRDSNPHGQPYSHKRGESTP